MYTLSMIKLAIKYNFIGANFVKFKLLAWLSLKVKSRKASYEDFSQQMEL